MLYNLQLHTYSTYVCYTYYVFHTKVELKKEQTTDRNYSTLYLRIIQRSNKDKQYYLLSKRHCHTLIFIEEISSVTHVKLKRRLHASKRVYRRVRMQLW